MFIWVNKVFCLKTNKHWIAVIPLAAGGKCHYDSLRVMPLSLGVGQHLWVQIQVIHIALFWKFQFWKLTKETWYTILPQINTSLAQKWEHKFTSNGVQLLKLCVQSNCGYCSILSLPLQWPSLPSSDAMPRSYFLSVPFRSAAECLPLEFKWQKLESEEFLFPNSALCAPRL